RPTRERNAVHADRGNPENVKQRYIEPGNYQMNRAEHRQMNLRPERVNHKRHQRGGGGDYRRQEVNKARRFVGDDVFLKNELEQIGEWLEKAAIANAIWSQAS